jgi:hypothetical protein
MEYKVVWTESNSDLEKEVNELIKGGWKPQGGVMVYESVETKSLGMLGEMHKFGFIQAMVKE